MSFLLTYHDARRAVVASDDHGGMSKFLLAGNFIFAALGRSDVCVSLRRGTTKLLSLHPHLPINQLALITADAARDKWAKRAPLAKDVPTNLDALDLAVCGYDPELRTIRSFVCLSYQNDFELVETTKDPSNRVFALGYYGAADKALFDRLTKQMEFAGSKGAPWVASQLRSTMNEMRRRYPENIGAPSFFAALDAHGFTNLPADFPLPPTEEIGVPAGAAHLMTTLKEKFIHLVTTNKETAFNGTNRFFVGSIFTPKAGAPDTIGNNDGGSGAQYGMLNTFNMSVTASTGTSGNGTLTNAANAIDSDLTTFAELAVTGNGAQNNAALFLSAPPGITRRYASVTLKVRAAIPVNSLSPTGGGTPNSIGFNAIGPGFNTPMLQKNQGTGAVAVATYSLTLPVGVNISQVVVDCYVFNDAIRTSGQAKLDIYEAWIEAVE